jgi:hypothetical protein
MINQLKKTDWIVSGFIPLALILMELCWVYPWLVWLGRWPSLEIQRPPLSFVSLLLIFIISLLVTRLLLSRKWPLKWVSLGIVICGLIILFVTVRIEYGNGINWTDGSWFIYAGRLILNTFSQPNTFILAIAAGIVFWWRGISRGRSPLDFEIVYRSFLWGIAGLVILIIVLGFSAGNASWKSLVTSTGLYVAGFFFCGLVALALTNIKNIQKEIAEKEGVSYSAKRRWLIIIIAVVVCVVLIGIGVAGIFSPDFLFQISRIMNTAAELLLKGLGYLIFPLVYLANGLTYLIKLLIAWVNHGQEVEPFQMPGFPEIPQRTQDTIQSFPPAVILALKWGLFAIVLATVVFLLVKAIYRYRPSAESKDEVEETNESLWSWRGFWSDFRLFFNFLFARFRKKKLELTAEDLAFARLDERESDTSLDIREIYRRLLWKTAKIQKPRRKYETPYEYAQRLGQAMPEADSQLSELTGLYIDVRYGNLPPEEKQVDQANDLWHILRTFLSKVFQA